MSGFPTSPQIKCSHWGLQTSVLKLDPKVFKPSLKVLKQIQVLRLEDFKTMSRILGAKLVEWKRQPPRWWNELNWRIFWRIKPFLKKGPANQAAAASVSSQIHSTQSIPCSSIYFNITLSFQQSSTSNHSLSLYIYIPLFNYRISQYGGDGIAGHAL